jgi:hypothetical protein
MTIDVRAQADPGQLAVVNTEHVTPAAAWLIRPAASDESAAAAPGSRITGNARVRVRGDGSFRDGRVPASV